MNVHIPGTCTCILFNFLFTSDLTCTNLFSSATPFLSSNFSHLGWSASHSSGSKLFVFSCSDAALTFHTGQSQMLLPCSCSMTVEEILNFAENDAGLCCKLQMNILLIVHVTSLPYTSIFTGYFFIYFFSHLR